MRSEVKPELRINYSRLDNPPISLTYYEVKDGVEHGATLVAGSFADVILYLNEKITSARVMKDMVGNTDTLVASRNL